VHDLAATISEWQSAGARAWLVRAIDAVGFGARHDVESMLVRDDGVAVGEILGPEVTRRIADRVSGSRTDTDGRLDVELSIHGGEAAVLGLTCGGSLHLVVEPLDAVPSLLVEELHARAPVAFASRLDGVKAAALVVDATGASASTLGDALVDQDVIAIATDLLRRGRSARHVERTGATRVLIDVYEPVPRAVIVGGGDLAGALEAQLRLIGWEPTTRATLTDASAAIAELGRSDAVVVLSHDPSIDAPAIAAALRNDVGYVGALGSRRTQAARAERLEAQHLEARQLRAVRGPAGLDVGASGPAETAVSIVAEILAVRSGRSAQPLRDNDNPIHVTR
jgi:xanthine dehydrogenase accessory factor